MGSITEWSVLHGNTIVFEPLLINLCTHSFKSSSICSFITGVTMLLIKDSSISLFMGRLSITKLG